MVEENIAVLAETMKILEAKLEAEPSSGPAGGVVQTLTAFPDIPALCEQLAVLVSTGKAKEAIRVQLTHKQVKRLSDKDVEKYTKRYQAYVGSKTTDSMIDSCIFLATKAVGMAVKIKDIEAYKKRAQKQLRHKQRALQSFRPTCFEVRLASCSGQHSTYHRKTYRL